MKVGRVMNRFSPYSSITTNLDLKFLLIFSDGKQNVKSFIKKREAFLSSLYYTVSVLYFSAITNLSLHDQQEV